MDPSQIASALSDAIPPARIFTGETERITYSYDASFETRFRTDCPDVVVRVESTEEVQAVVRWCSANRVPLTPRGAATSQSGGPVPVRGGLVLDLTSMNRILDMDVANLQVWCEPGVIHARLNAALREKGLFFPPDPGSSSMCTIGGMIANNSSGMRAVKYGQTKHHVLGLQVVLASGEVITTGGVDSKARKSVSGYDLTSLFVGSEGTLGIVTRARLSALPLPTHRAICVASFDALRAAGEAVQEMFSKGLLPSAIEILDRNALRAIRNFRPDVQVPVEAAVLLVEVEGDSAESVTNSARAVSLACESHGTSVEWTSEPEEAKRLWEARRLVGAAVARLVPGYTRVYGGEDICVPIKKVPDALAAIHRLAASHDLEIAIYGHVGDGNIHTAPIINMRDAGQVEAARALVDGIHELALDFGGTTTGEHGIGLVRSKYMRREHGVSLDTMRELKRLLDPEYVLNPGKMALEASGAGEE